MAAKFRLVNASEIWSFYPDIIYIYIYIYYIHNKVLRLAVHQLILDLWLISIGYIIYEYMSIYEYMFDDGRNIDLSHAFWLLTFQLPYCNLDVTSMRFGNPGRA